MKFLKRQCFYILDQKIRQANIQHDQDQSLSFKKSNSISQSSGICHGASFLKRAVA